MTSYLEKRFKEKLYGKAYEPKKTYTIPKKSKKKIEQENKEKERLGGDDNELVKFYKSAMKRMTGHCLWCGAKTETHIYRDAIFSICHILDKRDTVCPSVKTHPCNWVELCPDHHREFDTPPFEKEKTLWDKRRELGFWPEIQSKLIMMYPDLSEEDKRHFPDKVLQYIENNKPF